MGILPVLFTFAVAICIAFVAYKHSKKDNPHYDEMQLKLRADGYRLGFFTTLIVSMLLVLIYSMNDNVAKLIDPALGIFISMMIGIVIFVVYCILKDAYFHVGDKGSGFTILLIACTALNSYLGISRIVDGTLWEDGRIDFVRGGSNLVIAVTFLIILIAIIIKKAAIKEEVKE